MARIAVGGFMHETNCFVPGVTDFEYFAEHRDRPPLCRGDEIFDWLPNAGMALSGFLDAIDDEHELVPLIWTSGGAGALVSSDAFERCSAELVGALSQRMPVDAVYLDLHGACTSEEFEDGESELLRRVRSAVGNDIPIVVSHDYHANVTPETAELCDALCGYHTYPHIDRPGTGARAAKALEMILRRGRPTFKAIRKIPFLIPLTFQCTMIEPSQSIVMASKAGEAGDVSTSDVLTLAYLAGFPPSDQYWCGPSVVCHGYDHDAVEMAADRLEKLIEAHEADFAGVELTPDEAVREAMQLAKGASKPVVIADTQDNPGAGGTCDTTGLLAALVENDAVGAVIGIMCDPDAAARAHEAGENAEIEIDLGGKSGIDGDAPYSGKFTVAKLGNGKFHCTGPYQGGRDMDLGPMALLRIGGVSIVTASKRAQAGDQEMFRHLNIEPSQQKILALKSSVHFRAHFQPIAEEVLVALAPGGHISDPRRYAYKKLRPGIRLTPLGPEWAG
ncbi:MAG: M81 family metallopeptidase [Rhodospirillales bacterium]